MSAGERRGRGLGRFAGPGAGVGGDVGTKIVAFLLALVVFIVTRGEVTRAFTIPLRVVEDPERELLTRPPETIEVELRGPWANVNQLAAAELGVATLDLRAVRPGPMELDPAAIVMPRGVLLERLDYDPVDLRFEAVVERRVAITPTWIGTVDGDYLLGATDVEPETVIVRGPGSVLDSLAALHTAPVDLTGISSASERVVALEHDDARLTILGFGEEQTPTVTVHVELIPVIAEIALEVPTGAALREAIPGLPQSERVSVRGPRALLRQLEGIAQPLEVQVEADTANAAGGVTLRFVWSSLLDPAIAEQLSIEPPLIRLRMAPVRDEQE